MSASLRSIFIKILKNAVNAILTTTGPLVALPSNFNFHNAQGWHHVLTVFGSAVLAREAGIFGPKIWEWSMSNGDDEKPKQ